MYVCWMGNPQLSLCVSLHKSHCSLVCARQALKRKEKKIERKEKKAEELERIYLGEEQQEKKILKVKETAKDKVRYVSCG